MVSTMNNTTTPIPNTPCSAVIITGGASGIGLACAKALAEVGRPVSIWDLNQQRAEQAAIEIQNQYGVTTSSFAVDVSELEKLANYVDETRQLHKEIGGLVHAAGVDGAGSLETLTTAQWRSVIDINLSALPFLIKALLDDFKQSPGAAIVGIASINATLGNGMNPSYSASKAGMLGLVRALADDLGQHAIRINSVSPGQIDTPMLQASMDVVEGLRTAFENRILLSRLGKPEEIAKAVRFLLSDQASYITASELIVDGGNISSQR